MTRHRWALLATALLPILLTTVACGRGEPTAPPVTQPPTTSSPTAASTPSGTPSTQPGGGDWTSGSVTVTHDVTIPPVPLLIDVRSAAHPEQGYDRIVFDFQGALPGYTVRYVDEVRGDPSDQPVDVPGRRFLQITFRPAQAHTDAGVPTGAARSKVFDYPMMRGYVITGDFEAVLTVAIGLDDVVGYRVGELPGSIYLDVAA